MKIAHVTATFPPYEAGTGRVAFFNALELARRGHEVTVYTAAHDDRDYQYPDEIQVQLLPPFFRLGNAPLLPGLLGLRNVDIIHLHWPFIFGAEFTWLATLLRRIPYVITHHNDLLTDGLRRFLFDPYSVISNRLIAANARKFCVVSLSHAEECKLTPIFKRRWEDVVEVPNGVDISVFHREHDPVSIREKYEIPADKTVVTFVGALDRAHPFKGVDRLIRSFAALERDDVHLMVVGGGDMFTAYQQLAVQHGLMQCSSFVGKVPHEELGPYYAASDVVVLPSVPPESFGMVLIEAGACGRPVIASDIPGVRSVVQDGVDGFLVRPADVADLTQKMEQLIDDPQRRAIMGEAGYEKVQRKYAWSAVVEPLEAAYQEIVEG